MHVYVINRKIDVSFNNETIHSRNMQKMTKQKDEKYEHKRIEKINEISQINKRKYSISTILTINHKNIIRTSI